MSAESPDPATLTAIERVHLALQKEDGWGILRYPGTGELALTFAIGAAVMHPSHERPDPDIHPVYTVPEIVALQNAVQGGEQPAFADLLTARRRVIAGLPKSMQRLCDVAELARLQALKSFSEAVSTGGAVVAFADLTPPGFVQSPELARRFAGYSSAAYRLRRAEGRMASSALRSLQLVITPNTIDRVPEPARQAEIAHLISLNNRPGTSVHLAPELPPDVARRLARSNVTLYLSPDGNAHVATAEVVSGMVPNIDPLPGESPWRVADQQYLGPNSKETLETLDLLRTAITEGALPADETVEVLNSLLR